MSKLEKIAETLRRFNPNWSEHYRDMCRQIADDMDLGGADREKFLRESGAIPKP